MSSESSSIMVFFGTGVIIGIIVFISTFNILESLQEQNFERLTARDLQITLAAIIGLPGDIEIRYQTLDPNLRISVNETVIRVRSPGGTSTQVYPRILGVELTSAVFDNQLTLPILKKDDVIHFSQISSDCDFEISFDDINLRFDFARTPFRDQMQHILDHSKIDSDSINTLDIKFEVGNHNIIRFNQDSDDLIKRKLSCLIYDQNPSFIADFHTDSTFHITVAGTNASDVVNALEVFLN